MSMGRSTRRSGLVFLLIGMIGAAFFWATDPRFGPEVHQFGSGRLDWRHWLFLLRGSPGNVIDAANQTMLSTLVGVAGSAALLLIGLWLLTRRSTAAR
jgi:hypothetical protein